MILKREVIGQADCPLMYRWTLVNLGDRIGKLMIHYFLPTARDRDYHDHPRSFLTFVLRGGYEDTSRCVRCEGTGAMPLFGLALGVGLHDKVLCSKCGGTGRIIDEVRAPTFRFRRADHAHITMARQDGAWSLVVMGPLRRDWGFWREGMWWPWRRYEDAFGGSFRCEKDPGS